MAYINFKRYKSNDSGLKKEMGLAKKMLDKPGHFRRSQRDDAKDLLRGFGVEKKEKWGVFDE